MKLPFFAKNVLFYENIVIFFKMRKKKEFGTRAVPRLSFDD